MQSILEKEINKIILERIDKLAIDQAPIWGKMNCGEMVCHCSDQIKMALGEKETKFMGNFFTKTVVKNLVLLGMPVPKGKIETVPELKQGIGGTKPSEFIADTNELKDLVQTFNQKYIEGSSVVHPAFGAMNKKEWGKLIFSHLDHHLNQFSV